MSTSDVHFQERRHARAMTSMLLDVFDADFVPGGYSNPAIPWWIGATMHGSTARLKELLPSEKEARRRERDQLDDAREALGKKRRHKKAEKKGRIR